MAGDLKVGLPVTALAPAVALAAETGAPLGNVVRGMLALAAADVEAMAVLRGELRAAVESAQQRQEEAEQRRLRGQEIAAQAVALGQQRRAKGHEIAATNARLGKVKAAKPRRETPAEREERLDAEGALRAKRHRVWQVATSWSHEKQRDATPVEMRAWWMPRWRRMGGSEATWEGGTWGLSSATEAEDRAFAEEAVRTYVPAPAPR